MSIRLLRGDCRVRLPELEAESVQACVTSPPYWRQRDYGIDGQIGQEGTPQAWAAAVTVALRPVRRLLAPSGAMWVNVGDKYAAGGMGGGGIAATRKNWQGTMGKTGWRKAPEGYKQKDLSLAPLQLAEMLRADGWILRQTVIWEKQAAVEPVRLDRPGTSHEYVFLFVLREQNCVRDPGEPWWHNSVWRIAHDAHIGHTAVMPAELARRCIVASTKAGDTVLDPFSGAGTTLLVADRLGRHAVGIELNPAFTDLSGSRVLGDSPMFTEVEVA